MRSKQVAVGAIAFGCALEAGPLQMNFWRGTAISQRSSVSETLALRSKRTAGAIDSKLLQWGLYSSHHEIRRFDPPWP